MEKRLAVHPSEILHLELECEHENCHAITSLPFVAWPPASPDQLWQLVLSECPWCNTILPPSSRATISALLNALRGVRTEGAPNLRMVLHQRDRND